MVKYLTAGSSTSKYNPHFFKFMFPDLFSDLRIPKNFHKHLPETVPKHASLVTQSGNVWRVDVCQKEKGICFGSGWSEFVRAHNVQLGYLVVFEYEGQMIFNVKVFDTTCCLANKSQPSDFVDLTLEVKSEDGTAIPVASDKMVKNASDNVAGQDNKELGKPTLKGKKKMHKSSSHITSTVPQFAKILNRCSATKYRTSMTIPRWFCVKYKFVSERTVVLKNPEGKKWLVKFVVRQHNVGQLCTGWRAFSEENGLKEGDRCIFKLINKNTFSVYWKRHSNIQKEQQRRAADTNHVL